MTSERGLLIATAAVVFALQIGSANGEEGVAAPTAPDGSPALAVPSAAGTVASGQVAAPAASEGAPPADEAPAVGPAAERQQNRKAPSRQAGAPEKPRIERIDKFRARIGEIVVDRKVRQFTVPGKVVWEQGPLEFLAVARGGRKAYESVLELDVSAHEFNLACILIGLPAKWAKTPRYHFDPAPAVGKTVAVLVTWEKDGKRVDVPAQDLLVREGGDPPSHVWVYTGSRHARGQKFLAEDDGTLIGFAHDPASIIEHREGIGLGDYGSVGMKPGLLPMRGTPVRVTVRWISKKEAGIDGPPADGEGQVPSGAKDDPARQGAADAPAAELPQANAQPANAGTAGVADPAMAQPPGPDPVPQPVGQ